MSAPMKKHELALKRLCRYLKGHARLVQRIPFKTETKKELHANVDSAWAAFREARKSTNGGAMSISDSCLKTWSITQAVMALSSGEAEFYAARKGCNLGLGMQSIVVHLGIKLRLHRQRCGQGHHAQKGAWQATPYRGWLPLVAGCSGRKEVVGAQMQR